MVKNFDKESDITDQIDLLELKAIAKNWSQEQLYANLLSACPVVLRAQIRSKRTKDIDKQIIEAKSMITCHFESLIPRDAVFESFLACNRKDSEPISEFVERCEKMIRRSKPTLPEGEYDYVIKKKILSSMPTDKRSILGAFKQEDLKSFSRRGQDLLDDPNQSEFVHAIMAADEVDRDLSITTTAAARMPSLAERLEAIENRLRNMNLSPKNSASGRPKRTMECSRCGSINHRAQECRGNAFCNRCGEKGHLARICKNSSSRFSYSVLTSDFPSINVLLVDINRKGKALVDTGSCISLINKSLLKGYHISPSSSKIITVSGEHLKSFGKVQLKIKLNEFELTWEFVVLDQFTFDLIIGRDLIKYMDCTIDLNDSKILVPRTRSCASLESNAKIEEHSLIEHLKNKWKHIFASSPTDIGYTEMIKHNIDTGNHPPIRVRPYRVPHNQQSTIDKEIEMMLKSNIIRKSASPWCSPMVLVKKKDGGNRLCIDYRQLNSITRKDTYSLPIMEDLIDRLSGFKYFSLLDLQSGYWQCAVEDSSKEKTAFSPGPGKGLYEFNRIPFGLTNAPSSFQRLMDNLLGHSDNYTAYLDDIIIFSKDMKSHIKHIEEVLEKICTAGLKLKENKCKFALTEVNYLGFIVSSEGVKPDPAKIEPILNWKTPTNIKELQEFIGVCVFYQKFLHRFAHVATPLYRLLQKGQPWIWTEICNSSFNSLKEMISNIVPLGYPNWEHHFLLNCDASDHAVGAVLSQKVDGEEKPISFFSKTLNTTQRRYSATDRECLAIILAIRKFRHYLLGKKFTLFTYHNPLTYLKSVKNINGRRARWILELEEYEFEIQYVPGKSNTVADGLSRSVAAVSVGSSIDFPVEQQQDAAINKIKLFLSSHEIPQEPMDPKTLSLWRNRKNLQLIDGILYHQSRRGLRPVLPEKLRFSLFKSFHEKSLCHSGVNKTTDAISDIAYWPTIKDDILTWITQCESCQLNKHKNFTPKAQLTSVPIDHDCQRWQVDFTGPLPTTNSGNKYIIVFTNLFTKWVEAKAVPDQTASTAARALLECVVTRYGVPNQIHSDQGKHFESNTFKSLCDMLGIKKTRTTPYHPSGNGQVERTNRTIKEMLRHHVKASNANWDTHLDTVLFAIRSSKHASTNFTPAELTYGRKIVSPAEIEYLDGLRRQTNNCPTEHQEWINRIQNNLKIYRETATNNIMKSQESQKRNHDKNLVQHNFTAGDLVMMKSSESGKLSHIFNGPYVIIEDSSPVYKIALPNNLNQFYRIHHDHLYPYHEGSGHITEGEMM
ncbi:Transposon Tf2-6 polyprotein [Thelohanellus kitauei]|uniref:RNA-directed DNA polymerase n=1 Tax=Thelohanellus kitauei TaxID=669202 RepID=A0A0C2N5Z3_THEKT|nr:Transposon Tf2-6 polyprotein [Thelohanellus kitauei]KII71730.1 Transposon Tf2-6 polyprotein [Thelohanellus kitauei]KII72556.1 Transposon Tf2-6 polyprotein [Thelohanellus kitauei]